MKWPRHRHDDLDARVAEARASAEAAAREVDVSLSREQAVRERVNEPRREAAVRNQFAQIIAATLIDGHGRPPEGNDHRC